MPATGSIGIYSMISEIEDYAIIFLDKEGIVQNWNKGAQKIKQYREDEIIGKHFSIFYLPEDLKTGLPMHLIQKGCSGGQSPARRVGGNGRMVQNSGEALSSRPCNDSDGKLIGFSKVTRDLTDRKIADDKLRAYAAEFENSE
ncbi:MAG: PAS domain S-box protein [Bacteroidota bacterium]